MTPPIPGQVYERDGLRREVLRVMQYVTSTGSSNHDLSGKDDHGESYSECG